MSYQEVVHAIKCLATTQDKSAENCLSQAASSIPEYPVWLLNIVSTPSDDTSQFTASIIFKNYVLKFWAVPDISVMSEEVRSRIRFTLADLIFNAPRQISSVLSEPLSFILFSEDFYMNDSPCHFFVALLAEKLNTSTTTAVPIMNTITRRYRKLSRGDDLWSEIKVVCDACGDIVRNLFLNANLGGSKPIVKLCNNLTYQELEDHFADHYEAFIMKALSLLSSASEQVMPDLIALIKLLVHHVINYQEDILPAIPALTESIVRIAHAAKSWDDSAKLQKICLTFVRHSVPFWTDQIFESLLEPVIAEVIMPALDVKFSDLDNFEFSPVDYIESETVTSSSDVSNTTLKGEAIFFLNALASKPSYSEKVLNITSIKLNELQNNGNYISLVRLFTATSCILFGPQKGTVLRPLTDFCNTIISLFSSPPADAESSYLLSECFNFLTLYYPVIDQAQIIQIVTSFATNNMSTSTSLSLLAHFCATLTKIIGPKFSQPEFETQLLQYLYSIAPVIPDLTKTSYYVNLLTKLVAKSPNEVVLSGDGNSIFIFNLASSLFSELPQSRSLPSYNIAVCRLISVISSKFVSANSSESEACKQQLLSPICNVVISILQKHEDLTELMPLALQIWALINTVNGSYCNLANGTSFNYLDREVWEISGYVPGLCALIQSIFITDKTPLIGQARNLLTCSRIGFIDRNNAKFITTLTLHIIKYLTDELDGQIISKIISMFNSKTCTMAFKSPSYTTVLLALACYDTSNTLNSYFCDEKLISSFVKSVASTTGFNRTMCAIGIASRFELTSDPIYVQALATISSGVTTKTQEFKGSDDEASLGYTSSAQIVPLIFRIASDNSSPVEAIQQKLRNNQHFLRFVNENSELANVFSWIFQ